MEHLPTGIDELDLVLAGGLRPGSLVVLAGAPGTGKTILAQQICFASATPERRAIYCTTMSEPHSKLVRHLEPFGFFDPDALGRSVEFLHLGDLLTQENGDGLAMAVSEVVEKCFKAKPAVVVIDSAKALQVFADDQSLRVAYYELASRVAHTGRRRAARGGVHPGGDRDGRRVRPRRRDRPGGVRVPEPVDRRWLRVVKMRGANHLAGKHSFRISDEGCEVFARLETIVSDERPPRRRRASLVRRAEARRADGRRHPRGRRHRDPRTVGLREDGARAALHRAGARGRGEAACTPRSRRAPTSWSARRTRSAGTSRGRSSRDSS